MRSDIRNLFRIALFKFKSVRTHVSVYNTDLERQIVGLGSDGDLELIALHSVDPGTGSCTHADDMSSRTEHDPQRLTVGDLAVENIINVDSYRNNCSRRKSILCPEKSRY